MPLNPPSKGSQLRCSRSKIQEFFKVGPPPLRNPAYAPACIGTRLLWGTYIIAPGEIFENLLQLKRFGLYFEGILRRKWLLSYRNNDISYRDSRGFGVCSPRKF